MFSPETSVLVSGLDSRRRISDGKPENQAEASREPASTQREATGGEPFRLVQQLDH